MGYSDELIMIIISIIIIIIISSSSSSSSTLRGSAPRSNPLPFYIPFFTKKVPLSYTFY